MISMIFASDENGLIGVDNRLPWSIPKDLQRFRSLTINQTVIMGRKTFDSLPGKSLAGRRLVVLSSKARELYFYPPPGTFWYQSLQDAFRNESRGGRDIFIIGGAKVFEAALPYVSRIYQTSVYGTWEGEGEQTHFRIPDQFLPSLSLVDSEECSDHCFKVFNVNQNKNLT